MSSFIGHSLIGSALFARQHPVNSRHNVILCLFVTGLAVSPDVDYLLRWLFHIRLEPRYTHSLAYCLSVSLIAWGLKATFARRLLGVLSTPLLFSAPLSHLGLDLMVGVYPMPLFFPFTKNTVVLPFGVLPSAGKIQLSNYYFWRNLAIEMGILLPLTLFFVPRWKATVLAASRWRQGVIFVIFLSFVIIGSNLTR